jgi:hypothetical protein
LDTFRQRYKGAVILPRQDTDPWQTLAVLNPFGRIDQHIMDDSDVAGPILFFLIFGTSLLVCSRSVGEGAQS